MFFYFSGLPHGYFLTKEEAISFSKDATAGSSIKKVSFSEVPVKNGGLFSFKFELKFSNKKSIIAFIDSLILVLDQKYNQLEELVELLKKQEEETKKTLSIYSFQSNLNVDYFIDDLGNFNSKESYQMKKINQSSFELKRIRENVNFLSPEQILKELENKNIVYLDYLK